MFQNCIIITTTIKTTLYVLFLVSDDLNNASINVLLQLNVLASRCRSVMQSCNVRTKTFNMSS